MVTVLIPCNSLHKWVEQSIKSSAKALNNLGGEILVVLDGISIRDFRGLLGQLDLGEKTELTLIESPKSGIVEALNFGLGISKYDFIARMDSDDEMLPDRLNMQREFLIRNHEVVAVGGAIELINENGASLRTIAYPIESSLVREKMKSGSFMAHPAVMFRKESVIEVGGYRDLFPYAEDFDLWVRLLGIGELANLQDKVIRYRQHPDQVSNLKRTKQEESTETIIWLNRIQDGISTAPGWLPTKSDELTDWLHEVKKLNLGKSIKFDEVGSLMKIRNLLNKSEHLKLIFPVLQFAIRSPHMFMKLVHSKLKTKIHNRNFRYLRGLHSNRIPENHHVHIKLNGGFGNQLFQYAFGCSIRDKKKLNVFFDVTNFEKNQLRSSVLVDEGVIHSGFSKQTCLNSTQVIEKNFSWSELEVPNSDCSVFEGYWQSWRYISEETLHHLRRAFPPDEIFEGITIHIRGGDYRTNPLTRLHHGLLDENYYARARMMLPDGLPVRVVTDDPSYANEILKKVGIVPIKIQCSANWKNDFTTLLSSRYLIIANSSFSWWAAYLSEPQTVIAPRGWFTPDIMRENNTADLFPKEWFLC